MVIFWAGNLKPIFKSADFILSLLSWMDCDGSPTMENPGSALTKADSTSTYLARYAIKVAQFNCFI